MRCPTGLGGETFFQKHAGTGTPKAVVPVEIDGETHLAIKDLAGLISLVQIGVLEIHPWGSTVDNVEQPDRITFDLDPDIGLPWSQVAAAALEIRDVLTGFGLQSFAKTTGGKGLHVVVPLTPELRWEEIKSLTKAVADHIASQHPHRYTTNQSKRARQGTGVASESGGASESGSESLCSWLVATSARRVCTALGLLLSGLTWRGYQPRAA